MAARRRGGAGEGTAGSGDGARGRQAGLHTQRSGDGSGGGELDAPSATAGASAAMKARRGRGWAARRPRRAASTLVVVAAAAAAAAPDRARRRQRGAPAEKASIEGTGGEGGNGGGKWKESVLRGKRGRGWQLTPDEPGGSTRQQSAGWRAPVWRLQRLIRSHQWWPTAAALEPWRSSTWRRACKQPRRVQQTPCNWVQYTAACRASAAPSRVHQGRFRQRRCVVRGELPATAAAAAGALSIFRA